MSTRLKTFTKIMFYLVMFIPAFVLISFVNSFALRVYQVSQVDSGKVVECIQKRFEDKLTPKLEFENVNGETGYKLGWNNKLVTFEPEKCDVTVYFFGASSLLASFNNTSFPSLLEVLLKQNGYENSCVYNFGMGGIDLNVISHRVKNTVSKHKPDLILIYSGHNDYTNTYHNAILPHYKLFPKNSWHTKPFKWAYSVSKPFDDGTISHPEEMEYFKHFLASRVETHASKLLINLGLLKIKDEDQAIYNREILSFFKQNANQINDYAISKEVPIAWITPVSNLQAIPFGINARANQLYEEGTEIEDYKKRIDILRKAKDLEFFSEDIRAKTKMLDFIRKMEKTAVFVMDLESQLIEDEYHLNYKRFYDYVHLQNKAHTQFARKIFSFIVESKLVPNHTSLQNKQFSAR